MLYYLNCNTVFNSPLTFEINVGRWLDLWIISFNIFTYSCNLFACSSEVLIFDFNSNTLNFMMSYTYSIITYKKQLI